jgi:hypothetical protein
LKTNPFYLCAVEKAAVTLKPEKNPQPLTKAEIESALENCIYSDSFKANLDSCSSVLFVVDKSFAEKTAFSLLEYMIATAEESGKKIGLIDLSESSVIEERFGDKIIKRDPEDIDAHAFYGITKAKTPVMLHKAYLEHELIVAAGRVVYSTLTGYTGGCSIVFPSLAPVKSLVRNNLTALDFTTTDLTHPSVKSGEISRNPMYRDRVDAVMITRVGRTLFGVNVLADDEGQLTGLVCGDLFMAHHKACAMLDEANMLKTNIGNGSIVAYVDKLNAEILSDTLLNLSEIAIEGGDIYIISDKFDLDKIDIFLLSEDELKAKISEGACGIYYKALRLKQSLERFYVSLCGGENAEVCSLLNLNNIPATFGLRTSMQKSVFVENASGKAFRLG